MTAEGFLVFFAVVVIVTYGITCSLLLASLRAALFSISAAVSNPARRLWLVSGLYCNICVGTWVSFVAWGVWLPHPPLAYPIGAVAVLVLLTGLKALPSADAEFMVLRDLIFQAAQEAAPEADKEA